MRNFASLLAMDLLNNPVLLVVVILACMAVIVTVAIVVIRWAKIKAAAKRRAEAREAAKEEKMVDEAKTENFAKDVFAAKEEPKPVTRPTQSSVNSVLDTVQHNKKETAPVELKRKAEDKHKKAMSEDVISIMQGGVSSAGAYKKADAFEIKKEKEKKKADTAKAQGKVDNILGMMGGAKSDSTNEEKGE